MQARIKATGQIIELCPYVYDIDGNDFLLEEVELLNNHNWPQVRIQAAIAAMQTVDDHVSTVEELAGRCVRYADALIAELQKKGLQNE